MALVTSGAISIGGTTAGRSINLELGRAATATSNLNEAALRALAEKASGAISLANFYGKSMIWAKTLGGAANDYGSGIAVDGSGNVYVTGYTNSAGAGGIDVLIAKYNISGTIQWQRTLGGAANDYGNDIAVDGSGNVYVAGHTYSAGAGGVDVLIAKYNTSGTIQWQRTLGGAVDDYGNDIAVDGSGNVYVTGYTYSAGAGGVDVLIAKYNTSGTIQWQRTLGGAATDVASSIAVDGSGNVYVTGYTYSAGAGGIDVLIAKYNTSGTIQWQRTLGGAVDDYGNDIAVDGSGNVYVTSYTYSAGAGGIDVLIAKYNTSGTIQWQRTLGGAVDDYGRGIAVDGSGNVYVTGYTYSAGAGGYDVLIAVCDSNGNGNSKIVASSLTSSTASLTSSTASLTSSTASLTSSTSPLTSSTASLTSANF